MSATQIERYCLRLLLFKRTGPKSFEDLRTVDGIVQETFQATCFSLGFLEYDEENDRVMEEASLLRLTKIWKPKEIKGVFSQTQRYFNQ